MIQEWKNKAKVPSSLKTPPQFLAMIKPGMKVLDVGCGEANAAADIREAGGEYWGIDCNLPSIIKANSPFVMLAEGENLPFKDTSFDIVLVRAVLTVLPNLNACQRLLEEALRVSKIAVGIQDFLQTWEDSYYAARYQTGEAETGEKGAFLVREGEQVLYRARHFTHMEILNMVYSINGKPINTKIGPVQTRSGKTIQGICMLYEKKS